MVQHRFSYGAVNLSSTPNTSMRGARTYMGKMQTSSALSGGRGRPTRSAGRTSHLMEDHALVWVRTLPSWRFLILL